MAARRVILPRWGKISNITEDVRKYSGEQGIAEGDARRAGIEEMSKEFVKSGTEVYANV